MIKRRCQLVYTLSLTTLQEWALFSGFRVKKTIGWERGMPEGLGWMPCAVCVSTLQPAFRAGARLSRLSMITGYQFPRLWKGTCVGLSDAFPWPLGWSRSSRCHCGPSSGLGATGPLPLAAVMLLLGAGHRAARRQSPASPASSPAGSTRPAVGISSGWWASLCPVRGAGVWAGPEWQGCFSGETTAELELVAKPGLHSRQLKNPKQTKTRETNTAPAPQILKSFLNIVFGRSRNEYFIWFACAEDFPGTLHTNAGSRINLAVFCRLCFPK